MICGRAIVQAGDRMTHGVISFNWSAFLGPFHVVMLHFPIGFFALAVLLEIWATRRPSEGSRQAVGFTLRLSAAVAWLVALLGYLRAQRGEYDTQVVYWHMIFGLTFAALTTATAILYHRWYPYSDRIILRRSYRGLLGVSALALAAAAHGGGTLTHGSKFLTEGAPPVLHELFGSLKAAPVLSTAASDDTFRTTIEPILTKHCYPCHGPEKQKGKLRLDSREEALKGGSSGEPALVPGNPLKSRMVVAALLPPDHDEVMPPSGKATLSPEEILALIRWIQRGGPYAGTSP